jgi:ubiquinone/menaquinone biosynthesis C-methylase UbiE
MDEQIARQLMEKVKHDYESIAEDFSQTRQNPWQEFSLFESFLHPSDRVLDLGCGNGRLLDFLHGKIADYTGLDISQKLLQEARKKYSHGHFLVGDMLSLPFPDAFFDVVFCIASLHHIPSRDFREKVILEIKRVLKPQGFFILTVWNLWQLKFLKYFPFIVPSFPNTS